MRGGNTDPIRARRCVLQKKYHKMDKDWKNTKTQILYERGDVFQKRNITKWLNE